MTSVYDDFSRLTSIDSAAAESNLVSLSYDALSRLTRASW